MPREDLPILNLSNPKHKRVLKQYIDGLEGNYRFEFTKVRGFRTSAQNRWWHGVVFPLIARELSELWGEPVSMLQAKAFLKDRYLRFPQVNKSTGEVMGHFTKGTSELDVAEGVEFSEAILKFAVEELG